MTKEKAQKLLATLFETSKRDSGEEYAHFRSEVMDEKSESYPIYKAVSDTAFKSQLTHDFSYEIATRSCDILAEVEDWDELAEWVDGAVPIYNGELALIYAANSWAVDEAVKELGSNDDDSMKRAALGWYYLIETFTNNLKDEIEKLIEV